MKLHSIVVGCLAGMIVGLSANEALADERTEARRHFRRGMELVVEGRLDEGVVELEEAYQILPHPNVLYNIGRAYAEAGRYDEAIDYFDRYLESGPPDTEEVRGYVEALNARVAALSTSEQTAAQQAANDSIAASDETPRATVRASTEEIARLRSTAARLDCYRDAYLMGARAASPMAIAA